MPDDIDPTVQVHIDAANLAESQGNHAARSASATEALKAWGAKMHPVPGPEPRGALAASERLAHVQKDPGWRDKFFAGDTATHSCEFIHPLTRQRKVIVVDVSADELAMAQGADEPELYCQAFALARAYPQAQGFAHDGRPRKLS
jgi:hypothetical protein